MKHLLDSLKVYFTYLDKHNLKWDANLQNSLKPLNALYDRAEQLRLIKQTECNEIDAKLPDVKSRLISKIKMSLEEEILLLNGILRDCDSCNKELKNKLVAVEKSAEEVECSEMLLSTALYPAPSVMLEWTQDAWRLYHIFYVQINCAMKCLNYEDEDTVSNLREAFQKQPEMKQQIESILSYTKCFVEES